MANSQCRIRTVHRFNFVTILFALIKLQLSELLQETGTGEARRELTDLRTGSSK